MTTAKMKLVSVLGFFLSMSLMAADPQSPLARVMDRMNADIKQIKKDLTVNVVSETLRGDLRTSINDFAAAATEARGLPPDVVKADPDMLQKFQGLFDDMLQHCETFKGLLAAGDASSIHLADLKAELISIESDERAGHSAFRPHKK